MYSSLEMAYSTYMQTTPALKLSTSRKVAHVADPIKGARVKNCFSLPAGRDFSCPGATAECDPGRGGYCYAGRDEMRFPSVSNLVRHNFDLIMACGRSVEKMVELLRPMIGAFRKQYERRGLPLEFRWHEDGDFVNLTYAKAVAQVCRENPDIQFWAYTRSFYGKVDAVPTLVGVDNLALYVSVDDSNARYVNPDRLAFWEANGVKVARVTADPEPQETMVNLIGRKAPICPEINNKIPLVSESGVGACIVCGMCVTGKAPVIFPIHR